MKINERKTRKKKNSRIWKTRSSLILSGFFKKFYSMAIDRERGGRREKEKEKWKESELWFEAEWVNELP